MIVAAMGKLRNTPPASRSDLFPFPDPAAAAND